MRTAKFCHGFAFRLQIATFCMLAVILGTASSAQVPAATPAPDIVVQGEREQALQAFVASMTNPDRSRQLARWSGRVCPTVIGIDPTQASEMATRISDIAATLHLRPKAKGCLTTMLIIVDNDASGVAASLAQRFPISLRKDGQGRLNRFVASKRPVRWLSVTNRCGFGGCFLSNSRLHHAESPAFQAVIVLVDGQQIGKLSLAALSDYVALVALANPPFGKTWPSTSIMSVFDRQSPDGTPARLSEKDMAFLKGLYASRADGLGQSQRSSIVARMKKELPRN